MRGRGLIGLGWIATTLVALSILAVGVLETPLGKRALLGYVLQWLRPHVTGHIEIGRIEGNLLTRVVLREIRLIHPVDGRAEIVAVEAVSIQYHLLDLVTGGEVRIRRLDLTRPDVQLVRRDGRFPIVGIWKSAPDARPSTGGGFQIDHLGIQEGRVRVEDISRASTVLALNAIRGAAAIQKTDTRWDVAVESLAWTGEVPSRDLDAFSTRVTWRAPGLAVRDLNVTSGDTTVTADVRAEDIRTGEGLDGRLQGTVDLGAWHRRLAGRADVRVELLTREGRPAARGVVRAADGEIAFELGPAAEARWRARADVRHLNPARLLVAGVGEPLIPTGDLNGSLVGWLGPSVRDAQGLLPFPFAVDIRLDPSRLGTSRIDLLSVSARSGAGGAARASIEIRSDLGRGRGEASVTVDRVTGDLVLALGDLRPLGAVMGWTLEAPGSLRASLKGTTERPIVLISAELDRVRFNTVTAGGATARTEVERRTAGLQGHLNVEAKGVAFGDVALGDVHADAALRGARQEVRVRTAGGALEGEAEGVIQRRGAASTIVLASLRVAAQGASLALSSPATIRLGPGAVDIERFTLSGDAGGLAGTARVAGARVEASFEADRLHVDPFISPLVSRPSTTGLAVSGDGRLTGRIDAPEGRARLHLEMPDVPPVDLALSSDGRVVRGRVSHEADGGRLVVDLASRFDRRAVLRSTINGEVRAERYRLVSLAHALRRWKPQALDGVDGTLDGTLIFTGGTLGRPTGRGALALRDGRIVLSDQRGEIRDISADVRLDERAVRLVSLSARRGGPLAARGVFEGDRWSLTIDGHDVILIDRPGTRAVADFDLAANVRSSTKRVTGTVTLDEMHVPLPSLSQPKAGPTEQAIAGDLVFAGPEIPSEATEAPGPSLLDGWTGGVRIEVPHNAWIRGPDGQIEIAGALDVTMPEAKGPVVQGELRAQRGFYRLMGVKMDLESGTVRFAGLGTFNPLINVTARRTTGEYLLRVHVEGTAKEPRISFSSEPPLEETEIIALLVTGKTTDQLTQGERSSLGQTVGGLVSSAAANELRRTLGRQVPVDTIDIETGAEGFSDATVTLGKYLSEDVFIRYGRSFGTGAENELGLEWSMSDRFTLQTERSDLETGVDLYYKLRY
jgi:hypothetical protein